MTPTVITRNGVFECNTSKGENGDVSNALNGDWGLYDLDLEAESMNCYL